MARALIPCPACDRSLSPEAPYCPGCGQPLLQSRANHELPLEMEQGLEQEIGSTISANIAFDQSPHSFGDKTKTITRDSFRSEARSVSRAGRSILALFFAIAVWFLPYIGPFLSILAILSSLFHAFAKHFLANCPHCDHEIELVGFQSNYVCGSCKSALLFSDGFIWPIDATETGPTNKERVSTWVLVPVMLTVAIVTFITLDMIFRDSTPNATVAEVGIPAQRPQGSDALDTSQNRPQEPYGQSTSAKSEPAERSSSKDAAQLGTIARTVLNASQSASVEGTQLHRNFLSEASNFCADSDLTTSVQLDLIATALQAGTKIWVTNPKDAEFISVGSDTILCSYVSTFQRLDANFRPIFERAGRFYVYYGVSRDGLLTYRLPGDLFLKF